MYTPFNCNQVNNSSKKNTKVISSHFPLSFSSFLLALAAVPMLPVAAPFLLENTTRNTTIQPPQHPSSHQPLPLPFKHHPHLSFSSIKWVIPHPILLFLFVIWVLILGFDFSSCYLYGNKCCFDILVADYTWKWVMIELVHDHASSGCDDGFWLFYMRFCDLWYW